MLPRKTIIVLVITFMVTTMMTAFSYLYVSQILRLRIANTYDTATSLAHQLAYAAKQNAASKSIDTSNPATMHRALEKDVNTNNLLQSEPGDWSFIYDVSIVDTTGKALLHSNASLVGKVLPPRPEFQQIVAARFRQQLRLIYSPASVYDVTYPLQLNGEPFSTIRIGVQTVFLRKEVEDRLIRALYVSIAAVFVALLLAAGISKAVLLAGEVHAPSLNLL